MRKNLDELYSHIYNFELNEGINETMIPYAEIYKRSVGEIDFPIQKNPLYIVSDDVHIHDGKK